MCVCVIAVLITLPLGGCSDPSQKQGLIHRTSDGDSGALPQGSAVPAWTYGMMPAKTQLPGNEKDQGIYIDAAGVPSDYREEHGPEADGRAKQAKVPISSDVPAQTYGLMRGNGMLPSNKKDVQLHNHATGVLSDYQEEHEPEADGRAKQAKGPADGGIEANKIADAEDLTGGGDGNADDKVEEEEEEEVKAGGSAMLQTFVEGEEEEDDEIDRLYALRNAQSSGCRKYSGNHCRRRARRRRCRRRGVRVVMGMYGLVPDDEGTCKEGVQAVQGFASTVTQGVHQVPTGSNGLPQVPTGSHGIPPQPQTTERQTLIVRVREAQGGTHFRRVVLAPGMPSCTLKAPKWATGKSCAQICTIRPAGLYTTKCCAQRCGGSASQVLTFAEVEAQVCAKFKRSSRVSMVRIKDNLGIFDDQDVGLLEDGDELEATFAAP